MIEELTRILSVTVVGLTFLLSTSACSEDVGPKPERWTVEVLRSFPHDREAFTQGLVFYAGKLFESTGQYQSSSLRRIDPQSGRVEKNLALGGEYFAEGLARVGDELIQLTWQNGEAFVYNVGTFQKQRTLRYKGEGWGLCHDGNRLIMSDGSSTLTFRSAATLQKLGELQVRLRGRPQANLNELEFVDGVIYANIWQEDRIVRIDPQTGRVTADIDVSGLRKQLSDSEGVSMDDVINGIAWEPERKVFYLTGKDWPKMFEARFVPVAKK